MNEVPRIIKMIVINFLLLIFSNGCSDDGVNISNPPTTNNSKNTGNNNEQILNTAEAQCIINDKRRLIGRDAPALSANENNNISKITPSKCSNNNEFKVGVGIYDATPFIGDVSGVGNVSPFQILSGLHTRMHARAFAMESLCNGKRLMYIALDHVGIYSSHRDAVLAKIAADPDLKDRWNINNVFISSSHTHSSSSSPEGTHTSEAIFQAIRRADINMQSNPEIGNLKLAAAELLNTNNNRSRKAYENNPLLERQKYLDIFGNEIRTNREMVQLELHRNNKLSGIINWFGIHTTSLGPEYTLISSDSKGFASLGFERLMQTNYYATPEQTNFVAAFSQAEVGDSTPSIFAGYETDRVSPELIGAETSREANTIVGTKQLAKALELLDDSSTVFGTLDYQYSEVSIDDIVIDDPIALETLKNLPDHLDSANKRTCDPVRGLSFAGGGMPDAPGPAREGLSCADLSGPLGGAINDVTNFMANFVADPDIYNGIKSWPIDILPSDSMAMLFCNIKNPDYDYSCQAEKPAVAPEDESNTVPAPFHLVRIGPLALLGLPFEVSTMAGRRIKQVLLDVLKPVGITKVVVVSVSNGFMGYLVTREEYAVQEYEGAATLYGPWTHAAVIQESLKLARRLRDNVESNFTKEYELGDPIQPKTLVEAVSPLGQPGDVLTHPGDIVAGEDVSAIIVAGHPNNDIRRQKSYVYVERKTDNDKWESVAEDRDPRLIYVWQPDSPFNIAIEALPFLMPLLDTPIIGPLFQTIANSLKVRTPESSQFLSGGSAEAIWSTPQTLEPGEYRFRFAGSSRVEENTVNPYEAITHSFYVSAARNTPNCP